MWADVSYTDQQLLLAIKNGDREAFTALYHRHSVMLYKNLLILVKSSQIADEVLQDLFVKVWEKRATIQINGNLADYLYRIGENLVYDFFRSAARDRQLKEQLNYYLATDSALLLDEPIENEALLVKAIDELPPQRRRIFRLCKIEGKSYQEVSSLLGISVSTVNDHIVKATKAIQKRMTQETLTYFIFLILLQGLD